MEMGQKIVLSLFILILIFSLSACQSVEIKEYDSKGKLRKHYIRKGLPNWSDNKKISLEAHGL